MGNEGRYLMITPADFRKGVRKGLMEKENEWMGKFTYKT